MGALAAPPESQHGSGAAIGGAESAAESGPAAEGAGSATQPDPASGSAAVESNIDQVNYSLGYELGQDLKRENLKPAPEALMKGVEDAISGAKPRVKTTERRAALAEIKAKRAQENLERSQAFLAANAQKEGVKTLPSGLQYKELTPGEGKTPAATGKVTVNYRGTLIDGSEFDSSYERGKPATFLVRKVIKGWREAVQLMKEGAKWELYIPPDLAYGKQSPHIRIPPNSALIYEVELLSFEEAPAPQPRRAGPPAPPVVDDE
jgi:FKBP-type peptidyl-prolyl cis-trans isomerase